MTKLEIINETADFYNLTNRGVKEGTRSACSYLTPEGLKCAFGRCMTEKALNKYGTFHRWVVDLQYHISGDGIESLDGILEPQYHGHEVEFWKDLQSLHDDPSHWIDKGLSYIGVIQRDKLVEKWQEMH